ncbi:hypothetical protein D3C72_1083400 [compost metagenome]
MQFRRAVGLRQGVQQGRRIRFAREDFQQARGRIHAVVETVPAVLEEDMAAHFAAQRRARLAQLGFHQRVARLVHQRHAAMLADPRRQVARAFHVVQNLRARMAGQHVGGKQHHLAVRVDDLAILGDHAQAVTVAVEGDADFSIRLGQAADQVLQVFRMRRVRMVVREIAIDFAEQFDDFAAHAAEQVARERAGHAIAAIDGDLDRARQLDVAQDALEVGGTDIVRGIAARIGNVPGTGAAVVRDDAVV